MTLDQLRAFVTVAQHGHMTRAARALNLTQSAVSAAVAALESRHGTQLFHRIGRGIQLTAEGQLFLGEALAVLNRAEAAERALTELSGLKRGTLKLWASHTIADPALVAEKVGEDEMVLAVGAHHPWSGANVPDLATLAEFDWILREPGSGTRQIMEQALAELGLTGAALKIGLELPSNEAVCAAVAVGAGATVISRLVAAPRVALGDLAILGPALSRRDFCAVRTGARRRGRAEQALLALIQEG